MRGDGQVRRVPPVLRDAGEDDSEVYVIGVRESTDPQSWSLLLMEFDEDENGLTLTGRRASRPACTSGSVHSATAEPDSWDTASRFDHILTSAAGRSLPTVTTLGNGGMLIGAFACRRESVDRDGYAPAARLHVAWTGLPPIRSTQSSAR